MYPTAKASKRREKFQQVVSEVDAVHKRLWPNVQPPKPYREADGESALITLLPTSSLMAFLLWGWVAPKRHPESKVRAAKLLSDIITIACESEGGLRVNFPAMFPDGSHEARSAVLDSGQVLNCWTAPMSSAISLSWDRDLQDPVCEVPTSVRARTRVNDYVLWALAPLPLNAKDENLRSCKNLLAPSALQILTHVAAHVERVVAPGLFASLDDPRRHDRPFELHQTRGAKRRRVCTVALNNIAARAAQKLFTGQAG